MKARSLVACAALTLTMAALVAVVPLVSQVRSTARTAASEPPPRTPWGDPDLQGIWTYETQIPFERPAKYAGREFFTEEEIADLDKQRSAQPSRNYRATRGSEADVAGAYNAVFLTVKPTGRRTSLITDPPDGKMPPRTPDFRKKAAAERAFALELLAPTETCVQALAGCAGGKPGPVSPRRDAVPPSYLTNAINRNNGPEDRSLGERCMAGALPEFGTAFGGSYRRIVQGPGMLAISYDQGQGQGYHRNIVMDGSPHPPASVRQRWGDSRGRWEGNTLVVDVANFSPKSNFQGASENLHLVERWTRVDAKTLEYAVTIDDSTVWTRPFTVKQEYIRQDEQANRIYYEPRCHEGNYSMAAMLQGTRLAEHEFAAGRGPDPATRCTAGCTFGPEEETQDPLR
ncbi:MAG: hypothetical protein GEU82_15285 [Luteitalea sp.]|nr:hypothetical protein [Luteitalea sp.]